MATAPIRNGTPALVSNLTGVTAIGRGANHGLALKSDGTVWAWGSNFNGQIGDNTTTSRNLPTQVLGPGGTGNLTGVSDVGGSNGGNHSHAVKSDGTLWSWGDNGNGMLGDGTTTQRTVPVQVSVLTGGRQIAGGRVFTLANQSLKVEPAPAGTEHNPPLLNAGVAGLSTLTSTGTFSSSPIDIAIAGRGPAPFLSRTYSSNDTRVGPLGSGWTFSYAMRLVDPEMEATM